MADGSVRRIGALKWLRMLDLGHNQLSSVPEALGDLESLTDFLYLHDNHLTSLSASPGQLTRLRYLNISDNDFDALPLSVHHGWTGGAAAGARTPSWGSTSTRSTRRRSHVLGQRQTREQDRARCIAAESDYQRFTANWKIRVGPPGTAPSA